MVPEFVNRMRGSRWQSTPLTHSKLTSVGVWGSAKR